MSDFESIEISIESSADKAEKQLDGVDKALADIQGSLKGITEILGNLDGKIAPISRSMNRLASDIEKLNPDVFKKLGNSARKSADDTEQAAKRIEKNIKDLATNLKDSFHIDRKGMSELKQALNDLYTAREKMAFSDKIGDERTFDEASRAAEALERKIFDVIRTYGKVKDAGVEAYKDLFTTVRSYFTGDKPIYIPVQFVDEYLDGDIKKMTSAFGRNFTTNIEKEWGTTLTQMVEDIESAVNDAEAPQFGFLQGKLTGNAVNDFKLIYDYAVQAKETITSMDKAIADNASVANTLKTEIESTTASIERLAQAETDSFMQSGMESYASDMQSIEQEATNVQESFNSMGESASTAEQSISEIANTASETLGTLSETLSAPFQPLQESITEATSEVEQFETALEEIEEVYTNFQDPVKIFDPKVLEDIDRVRDSIVSLDEQIKELALAYEDIQGAFDGDKLGDYSQSYKSTLFKEKEVIAQLLPMLKERKSLLENIQINRNNSLETFMETDAGLRIDKEKAKEAEKLVAEYEKLQLKEQQLIETGSAFKNTIGDTAKKFKNFSDEVKNVPKIDLNGEKSNTEIEQLIAKVKKLQEIIAGMKSGNVKGFNNEQFRDLNTQLSSAQTRLNELTGAMGKARPDSWSDVLKDIERMQKDYDKLSESVGEFNAEMQIAQDISNRVKGAMSSTKSGKMLIDVEKMREANEMLHETEQGLKIFYDQFKEPVEINTVQPRSELGKLYERAKELQELLSSMRNNRVQFDTSDVQRNIKELDKVNERIRELEGKGGSAPKKDVGNTEWLAKVIAMQHELEKASALFAKFGDIAKNAFLKAITPLKLFKHEFEEIKGLVTMVSRIGSAFAMISKPITKVFDDFSKKAVKSFEKIRKAWAKVVRTFTYMLIRKAITHIISTINEAIVSLAKFSKEIGTSFNYSMSLLTSDLRYIGAALVAAFSPILNAVVPSFDTLTDTIVGVINKINMFLAVLTRAKSYTIAKKKLVDYTEAMEDANKKAKQLTMGIDELNILNDSQEDAKKDEDKFDWLEIPTPKIDVPDWVKWIRELLKKLWDAIMGMLKALWDALKKAWENVRDFFLKAFKHLIESLVGLITDIIRDLTRLFQTEKFQKFLEQVLRIIAKIAELLATIIDKIREAWNYNDLGYKILEAILDILITIATHIENMLDAAIAWAKELTFIPLFEAFLVLLQKVNYAIDQIGWVIEDVFETLFLPLLKLIIENYLPRLILVLGDIVEGIGNIAKKFHEAWQATNFGERAVKAIDGIVQALLPHVEAVGVSFKNWGNQINFEPLLDSLVRLLRALKPIADMIGGVFEDLVNHYIEPVVQHIIEDVIPGIAEAIAHFADTLDEGKLRKNIDKIIQAFASLSNAIGGGVAKAMDKLGQKLANFVNSKAFADFIETITSFVKKIDADMVSKVLEGIGTAILHLGQAVTKFGNSKLFKDFLNGIINFMKNSSVQDIASTIEGIAKAFIAFKGLSFLTKTASDIAGLLVPIVNLAKAIGVGGKLGLIGVLAAGALAFITFHDQIARINWAKLFETVVKGITGLVSSINWEAIAKDLAQTVANLVVFAVKEAFNPQWRIVIIETIGNAFIEAFQGLGSGYFDVLIGFFEELGWNLPAAILKAFQEKWNEFWDWVGNAFQWLIDFVKSILGIHSPSTVFLEIGAMIVQGLWDGISEIWVAFWEWISTLWGEFVLWAQTTWQTIVDSITAIFGTLLIGIQEAWTLINEWFVTIWGEFMLWAQELWQGIVDFIVGVWSTVTEQAQAIWDEFWNWISETWTTFSEWVNTLWQLIHDTITGWWNALILAIQTGWDLFNEWIFETWTKFTEWVDSIWKSIHDTITSLWKKLIDFVKNTWQAFKNWLDQRWTEFKNFAFNIFGAVRDFIVNAWQKIHDKAVEYWNKIKNKLNEVWTWAQRKAHEIFEDIRNFIVTKWNKIHEKTTEIWSNVKSFLGELWGNLRDKAHEVFEDIHSFLSNVWNDIEMKWQTAWNAAKNTVKDIWDAISVNAHSIFEGARTFLETVWSGIKNVWASAWEDIHETVSSKWDLFKSTAKVKFGELKDAVAQKWDEIKIDAGSAWEKIKSTISQKWAELKPDAQKIFEELAKIVSKAWKDIKTAVGDTWESISRFLDTLGRKVGEFANKVKDTLKQFTDLQSKAKQGVDRAGLGTHEFADGGYPEKGSLFVAGEAGAELVGTINGKTAVANTQEITDAIEEAVGTAMEKVVAMMEKAMDRMADSINTSMQIFEKSNKQVIVELKAIDANILAIWKDERNVLKEIISYFAKIMDASKYEITKSNKELKDAYETDDSAVSSALTRISHEYEMSNTEISIYIMKLTEMVKGGMERIMSIVAESSERQISLQSQMVDYVKDAIDTLRNSIETNTNTKYEAPKTEVNLDTTEIVRGLTDLYDLVYKVADLAFTFAGAWVEVNDAYEPIFTSLQEYLGRIESIADKNLYILSKIAENSGISVPTYASGGFPEDGWFRASHGEIMGRFDNGQSVVANNSQITDGIAQAVSQSLVPILNDIADSSRITASKDLSVDIDSREIARANNTGQAKLGRSMISFT